MKKVGLQFREGTKNRLWCLYTQTIQCREKVGRHTELEQTVALSIKNKAYRERGDELWGSNKNVW